MAAAASALLIAAVLFVLHDPPAGTRHTRTGALVVRTDYYLGVSEPYVVDSYRQVNEFARAIGRQPNIVLYYSAWREPFQTRLAAEAYSHHAVPFVQINPGNVAMSAIAAGHDDAYLRSYANQVRAYGHPVIIGFAAEMNGNWDVWGYHHTSPHAWVAAWRHVVTVFRQQGASNATWLWTISVTIHGTGPIQKWWPGSGYVDWVGIDGYYYYSASTFTSVFGTTINQVRGLTSKPVLLSETAIGQVAGQAAKIPDLFAGIQAAQVVGFVWFDEAQDNGIYHQDWRLEGHPAAVRAFRRAMQNYQ